MFKPILMVAAFGAAVFSAPVMASSASASAPAPKVKTVKPTTSVEEPAADDYGMIPAAVLLSGVVLVTLANRRRNLQKVLN